MFANRLDQSYAGRNVSIANPTADEIAEAIQRLDGVLITETTIGTNDETPYMGVAGGVSQGLIVFATYDNETFFNLVDTSKSRAKTSVVAGGQLCEFEERQCVVLPMALLAARVFAETGELESSLSWEQQ